MPAAEKVPSPPDWLLAEDKEGEVIARERAYPSSDGPLAVCSQSNSTERGCRTYTPLSLAATVNQKRSAA